MAHDAQPPDLKQASGRPTNFSSTRMEGADLDLDEVDLGGLLIVVPAFMAWCQSGDALTLFADDSAAPGLSVCTENSACASYRWLSALRCRRRGGG